MRTSLPKPLLDALRSGGWEEVQPSLEHGSVWLAEGTLDYLAECGGGVVTYFRWVELRGFARHEYEADSAELCQRVLAR